MSVYYRDIKSCLVTEAHTCLFVCLCISVFLQQVLTQVLEEAGYKKDSLLVLSDFEKVLSHFHLP